MRFIDEANFLEPGCRARSWIVPAVVLRFAVSRKFGRYGSSPTEGEQLAAAPRLCDGRGRADHACRFADAGVFDFSGDRLRDHREDGRRCPLVADACAGFCGSVFVRVDCGAGGDAGIDVKRAGARAARFCGGNLAGGAVPVYGELYGGDADGSVCDFLYRGGVDSTLSDDRPHSKQRVALYRARVVAREQLSLSGGDSGVVGWTLHAISAGVAAAADRGVDRARGDFVAAARGEAMDSDRRRHGITLRDSVAAVDGAQRDHAARISAAGAEIFEFAGRIDSLRIYELGEDVAVSVPRRLSCVVE